VDEHTVLSTFSSKADKLKDWGYPGNPFDATVTFRGLALPATILPLRLAACDPAVRARPEAIAEVFENMLEELILPFALHEPLDISRAGLVAKPWGTGVRGWFAADRWVKVFGLSEYFTTHDQAAAALDVLKAIERPSFELAETVSTRYQGEVKQRSSYDGMQFTMYEGCKMRVGKLAGLPYTFLWRDCSSAIDSCWWSNVMLTMGTFSGGRLQYDEIYSYTTGESEDLPRLDLQVFLPLRARLHERFPRVVAAGLSDMQLLMLLTTATFPWPVDLNDGGIYGSYSFGGPILMTLAEQFKHVESMRGHPAKQPIPQGEKPPGGMEVDNAVGDEGYNYMDGLPLTTTLTKKFRADLKAKLGLVTEFHQGQRR
jgi:hypothetical protein